MAYAVEATGLRVAYGSAVALDGVSLTLPTARVSAILGPNGAGKTTFVETCEGYRRRYEGTVRVLGRDPGDPALRARVGVMLQEGGVWPALGAVRALRQVAALHARPQPVDALVERLGLAAVARTPFRRLSGGEKQRVKLAMALVGRPELAVLDEPTAGMDPQARLTVWELVRDLRRDGVTVLLTTHLMDEAEQLADHVAILDHGRVVTTGSPAELTAGGPEEVCLRAEVDVDSLAADLGASVLRAPDGTIRVSGRADLLADVVRWCDTHGVRPEGLTGSRRSLEDVFLDLTGRELR